MVPKFRCWDGQDMVMRDVEQLRFPHNSIHLDVYITIDGEEWTTGPALILMQSTGLKDKNGVEIFEGDLVKITVSNGFDHLEDALSIVKEAKYHSGLICELLSNTLEYRIFDEEATGYQYEIVSNIYENPELLDQSNES